MTPADLARSLTEAQSKALNDAATLLDHFAGEGVGLLPRERMGDVLFADDVVLALASAFNFEIETDFASVVRAELAKER